MSHSSILFQEYTININVNLTTFVVTSVTTTLLATRIDVVSTLFLGVFCLCDASVDFTCLQHTINNLEEGRMAHLSSNNNVQYSVSDEVWGNFVCRHVEQIRTAARDGDRAVGVNRTVAVEFHPSPSNQISQYQMFS